MFGYLSLIASQGDVVCRPVVLSPPAIEVATVQFIIVWKLDESVVNSDRMEESACVLLLSIYLQGNDWSLQ